MNKKKRVCSHKHARTKGLNFEREVAGAFREIGFVKAQRHLEFQIANAVGVDIDHTGPVKVQCKNMQKFANPSILKEIKDFTGIPVLLTKASGDPNPCAILPMKFFMELLSSYMLGLSPDKQKELGWTNPADMDLGF